LNDQPLNPRNEMSPEAIEVRIWGFVVVMVTLVLVFIVAMLLYSVTFVTQPIKSMAPIDQAYTKMLNDIVLLIVGGIGGIMTKRVTKAAANAFGQQPTQPPMLYAAQPMGQAYSPSYSQNYSQPSQSPSFNWMNFNNAQLDESWTPGPPPTTPPDHIHPEREEIAIEREAARSES
jgi:hypothetical protein